MKPILILFFFIGLFQKITLGQDINHSDSSISNLETTFIGIYALSDFVAPHPEISNHFSRLKLRFDSTNRFYANAGNSSHGYYVINDSNSILFYDIMSTAADICVLTESGYEYDRDLYFDTLIKCNEFQINGEEIRFFLDSDFKLSIKPYYDLLGFQKRQNAINKNVIVKKIDSLTIEFQETYKLINSTAEAKNLGIDLINIEVDFEKSSLIVIENKPLQKLKQKDLKKLIKNSKKQDRSLIYPVPYAKSYQSTDSIIYLDVVNTYFSPLWGDWKLRGKFTGYIIDKVYDDNLIINIKYVQ